MESLNTGVESSTQAPTTATETTETTENANTEVKTEVSPDELTELRAQIQNLTVTNAKLKRANDKLASENGDLNKKYRAKLSDEERAEVERLESERLRAEQDAEKDELIASLQREKALRTSENSYLAMGWTEDESKRMAIADVDNNFEERMAIMKQVTERLQTETQTSVLKNRPAIKTGNANGEITQAQFNRMSYKERVELATNNPELYKQLSGR